MKTIKKLLNENKDGLSITEITKLSKYSRSTVRTILAFMDGSDLIKLRQIGMAKVYTLK